MTRAAGTVALAAAAFLGASVIAAEEPAAVIGHWSYSLDEFTVVGTGGADDAVTVAQRLHGLDQAMHKLLHLPSGTSSPPTSVYLVPGAELVKLDPMWNSQGGGFIRAAPFDDYLVLASEHGAALDAELRAMRTLALLPGWGLARLPDWYRQGIAQLAAGAIFNSGTITIGQDVADQAGLVAHAWIPMEKILRLPANDAEFQSTPGQLARYRAQCWWLAHLMLIDRVLDPTVSQYIERLMAGQSQEVAFIASFNSSYEQLDEYFRKVRRAVQLKTYSAELPPAGEVPAPRPISEGAWRAHLAQLALIRDGHSTQGLQLAQQALAAQADNETALLALVRAGLAARQFTEVDALLQRLRAREDLSGDARRELAGLELQLAKHKEDGMPGAQDLDARKFRRAARADLRRALESDPNDLRALYQLAWLQCTVGDVAAVRELLPAAEAAYFHRPDSPELAALLVRMHSIAGTPADVFKYSVAEQRLALTEQERASAAARVTRLRSQIPPSQ